jgi:uncharacterized SAM-binding protein YcdF (DUF218 family)
VRVGCLIVLASTLLVLLGIVIWVRAAAGLLTVTEQLPDRADAIVVLGGGSRYGNRELRAAQLYALGIAPLVITTGGPVAGEETRATYAEWSVERLIRRGVPSTAAMATNEGDSTYTDALGVRRLASTRGWRDLVLVTDSWHTRRTEILFRQVFHDTSVQLWVSPAPSGVDPVAWWHDEDAIIAITTEYIKLGSYWVLGSS